MKYTNIIFIVFFFFSGCSIYNVSHNQELNRVEYNKNNKELQTGTASIFLGTTNLNKYDVFSKILFNSTYRGVHMDFYEDFKNVYFSPMDGQTILYGVTLDDRIPKRNRNTLSKIDSNNIECFIDRCEIFAQKSIYYIVMFEGDTGNVDFEYIDFKGIKREYVNAIQTYNISIIKHSKEKYIENFIPVSLFFKSIDAAKKHDELLILDKIYKYLSKEKNKKYKRQEKIFREAIEWKHFLLDYNNVIVGTLKEKKDFLNTYRKKIKKYTYYKIRTNTLNIRSNPTTKSKVLGKYYKADKVYISKVENGWGYSQKGWVFMKYLTKHQINKYDKKIRKVRKQVFNIYRENILKQTSIKKVKKYYQQHEKDSRVEKHLLSLYRGKSTLESYYEAYSLSKNIDDLKCFLARVKTVEKLDQYRLPSNALVSNRYATLYRSKNTSAGFLKAFKYSKKKNDIKESYRLANSIEEQKNIEYVLVKYFGINSVFQVTGNLTGNKDSGSSTAKFNKFIVRFVQSQGRAVINIKISKRDDTRVPLRYGSYRVRVKIRLALLYHNVAFGIGLSDTEYKEKTFWVNLSSKNNYINTKEVDFGKITQDYKGEILFKVSKKLKKITPIITFVDIQAL